MLHLLSLPLLAPLLIWQGRQVRQNIIVLPEPEGDRKGVVESTSALRLLILGDSSAAGVGAAHQREALAQQLVKRLSGHGAVNWKLVAKSGANTLDALRMLSELPEQTFDIAICVLGVNDVTSRIALSNWLRQQSYLRKRLRQRFGVANILVCGLPPMDGFPALPQPLRWYLGSRARAFENRLRRDVQNESGVALLPLNFATDKSLMAIDGFHPGPDAYRLWADNLANWIIANALPDED